MTCELHPQGVRGIAAPGRVVLLIDEIDTDIEFPNDPLQELDRMEFHVYEKPAEPSEAHQRPVVIINSNNEKELPEASAPLLLSLHPLSDRGSGRDRPPALPWHRKRRCRATALTQFFEIRKTPGLKKKPSTSEALDWLKLLLAEDLSPEDLRREGKTRLAAAIWRAAEERAGCATVRASGLHARAAGAACG